MKIPYSLLRAGENLRQHFFVGLSFTTLFISGTTFGQQHFPSNNSTVSSSVSSNMNFSEDPFTPYFIENKGQFDKYDANNSASDFKSSSYGSQLGNAIVLFNGSSIQFVENIIKNKEKENGGKEKNLKDERQFETWRQTLNFVNANPNATFEVEQSQQQYFTYPDPKITNGTITANAWGKLICKNIYNGIDVEFSYKKEGGIKYSFIVHPGADASVINIKWSGVDAVSIDADGNLQINSENGIVTDKAPASFYLDEENSSVASNFIVKGKNVSFSLGDYDHTKTLVIDPWVFSPALVGNNKAYDIQHDPGGNVYVYGGSNPYQLKKFTSAGAPIWTYNTAATGYYGDFTIDNAGNAFCIYGPWGDQCVKITPAGAMVWSVSQNFSREIYRVYPNPVNVGQLTIVGMGMPTGLTPMVLNINMATGAYSGPWYHPTSTAGETRGMAVDVNGDAYALVFSTGNPNAANNLLWKVNSANATVASVQDGYLLWESQASNTDSWYSGYNGVAVGCFVYTYDGITVKKWDKATLALLGSAVVPGGVGYVTAGLCLDVCGNLYVGGPNSILEYDGNLNFLTSVATTGQVYDVNLGNVPGEILGCGNGFFGSYTFPVCTSSAISVTATPATCSGCNGTATVTMNPTGAYTYTWSPSGGTGSTATGLCAGSYTVTAVLGCYTYTASIVVPNAGGGLTSTATQTNLSCNGVCTGSAVITVTGGTGPFTFTWSPAAANSTVGNVNTGTALCAGIYTVNLTDANGCTGSNTITITQPTALSVTHSQVNPLCNGGTGTASVVVSGGTGPYTYAWTPSGGNAATSTAITAGNYTCIITDAHGCTITQLFTIVAPSAITITPSQVNPLCNGGTGTATVVAAGGTGPYTYAWTPTGGNAATSTAIAAGNYTCTITDAHGCTITQLFTIVEPTILTTTQSQVNPLCNGGTGTATVVAAGGTGPYTYAWTPAGGNAATSTAIAAGNYTCTITDSHGCTITQLFTLVAPSAITATQSQVNPLCSGGTGTASVVASGGTGPYTYAWSPTGGNAATSTAIIAGNYTCTITDAHGCTITQLFTIVAPSAITATPSQVNPLCNGGTGTATVVASGGTGPYTYAWTPTGGNAATSTAIVAGNYTCTITDSHGCTLTQLFTIVAPTLVTATTTTVPATCGNPNGSATVTPGGGTGTYTYSWAPVGGNAATATGLIAGSYTVTVTDAHGCTTTATANVANTGGPTANITASTNISCFGGNNGSATVTVTGGTGPFTYAWTPSGGNAATASGLTANIYNVTVTDANGCITTANVTLTQPTALAATATSTPVLCNAGSTGSASVVASGGTGPYTYNWTPSGGTGTTASNLIAATYTCTVTDANGCSITAVTTVTQPTALAATQSQVNPLCNGGTGTGTVVASGGTGPYTYAWTPSGGNAATSTAIPAGNYTCTITDANGCTITQPFIITQPTLVAGTTTTLPSTCGNPNGSATVTPSGGVGPYTYSWAPVGGNAATATGLLAGSYTVTVTDSHGCTATAIATVINSGGPTANITASTNILCFGGNNGSATVTVTGGTGPFTYAWTPSGGNAAIASTLTANTYTVTVTDANGCVATANVTLTQPTALAATATSTPVLCNGGNSGSASVVATGGVTAYTYAWTPAGGNAATAPALTAGIYTCTVTDANGCTTTASTTVTQPTPLTTTASQIDELCNGGNNASATVTAAGGTPIYTYAWAPSGGNAAIASGLLAGTFTCTITDANGCFITQPFTITQPTAIVVTPTEVDAHCNQADGSASATAVGGTGGYNYHWMPGNVNTQNLTNVVSGTYTVTVTDANGCTGTASITINNLNGVVASATSTNIACFGQSTGSINVTQVGGNPVYTYAWLPNISVTDSATGIPAGSYQVTVTDANGCTSTVSVTLTQPPLLTISATATPTAVCNGSQVTLNSNPAGGTPALNVVWTPGPLNGNTQTFVPTTTATYTATVTDANGCTANATTTVVVNPVPVAALSGDNLSGCAPVCVNFSDLSTVANPGVIASWSWNFGDNSALSTLQNPSHCYNTPGVYTVTLNIVTADGCTATITMPNYINVFANPIAAFGASPQPTTLLNPQITFSDSSINATSWNWAFGDILNSTSILENPTFTYTDPTCYQVVLTVSSINGCTDTATKEICIGPDATIYVPNAFTPNGDGTNDVFNVVGTGIDPDQFQLWIFDRWGNMIFYTDDLNKGWDGRVQGHSEICQIDTYVWKLKAKDIVGNSHNLIGKVSLIK